MRVSNTGLMARVGLEGVENVLVRRRWRWLGHVMRMSEVRWPRRVLLWSGGEEEGDERRRGAPRLTWMRQIVREGWDGMAWGAVDTRKPHWVHWRDGRWGRY